MLRTQQLKKIKLLLLKCELIGAYPSVVGQTQGLFKEHIALILNYILGQ